MRKILTTLTLVFLGLTGLFSQQRITGTVTEWGTNNPLPGANVVIKGTTTGTVTDIDGNYSLEASPGNILVFSYIGYLPEEVVVGSSPLISVQLMEDIQTLSEFVIIGYGTQRKSDLTGSVAAISAEELRNVPAAGIDRALQGRVAGVTINANGGAPDSQTSIRIKGMGSIFSGNDPLFVVDGIPLAGSTRIENVVSASDIERIDVLKDASAAAIYGSRGSNGVIIITTKRGEAGRTRVSLNSYMGGQNPVASPQLADAEEYVRLARLAHTNAGRPIPAFFNSKPEGEWGAGTNWWNEILRDGGGAIQSHDLSVAGGTQDLTFASSIGYFNHMGYIKGSAYERISFSLNADYKFLNFFKAGSNIRYTTAESRGISENNPEGGAIAKAYQIPPTENKWMDINELLETANAGYDTSKTINRYSPVNSTTNSNVARELEQNNAFTRRNLLFGNLYLQAVLFDHLTLRTEYGVDITRRDFYNYSPVFFSSANERSENSSVHRGYGLNNNWVHNNTATWAQTLGRHSYSVMGGFVREFFSYEDLSAIGRNTPSDDPSFWFISSTTGDREAYGGANRQALMSYLGRVFYSYDSRYMVTMNVRRDGTSKFSSQSNNRWGVFPSVSAGWNLHNERFFQNLGLDWVYTTKFRASWGHIGNQNISDNAYIGTLVSTFTDRYAFGPNEEFRTAFRPGNNANPLVRWETQETTNFGTDMEFLRGKIQFTSDYFIRTTIDNLLPLPQPMSSGTPSFWANAGKIQNRGLEFTLKYSEFDREFRYSIGGNISFINNEVLELGLGEDQFPSPPSSRIGGSISNTMVGHPIAMFWGYRILGVFQNEDEVLNHVNANGQLLQPRAVPGDFIFADIGGAVDENGNSIPDGTINDNDRTFIGSPHPKTIFGGNVNLSYKGFGLDVFLQGQFGNDIFMYQRYYNYKGFESRFNQVSGLESKFWSGEGSTNSYPALNPFSRNNNYRLSEWWLSDGSYLRVKNITFSYTLPRSLTSRIAMGEATLYVTGENLLTFTRYEGVDPELGTAGDNPLEMSVDKYLYPVARTILTGVRINF